MPFFAVMGASGRTGAGCVDELLKQGHRVRAVVRSEASAEKLKAKGAETSIADVLDVDALKAAFTGVDGAYLMYPSGHTQIDILAHGQAAAAAAVAAAEAAKVPFVVILSSIGAQHPSGTGPIVNTHVFEQLLKKSSLSYTVVRGPGFLDNWGSVIGAAVAQGVFPTMYQDATLKFPQAFSYDIGVIAAQALIDGPRPPAKGQPRIIEVHGPEEYSVTDVANALGEVLGKPIHVVVVPPAQHLPFFLSLGMSEKTAPVMVEAFSPLTTSLLTFEGHEVQRGTTTAVAALRQLLAAPATH